MENKALRLKYLGIGIVLILIGLCLVSFSQTSVKTLKKNEERIVWGEQNQTEINATLDAGDEFYLAYSGGTPYANPEELDVTIYDSRNESTTVRYMDQRNNGIIANYAGTYRMQLLGLFIDPKRPIVLTVFEIHRETVITYPNSNLLPWGISIIMVGTALSIFGFISSKERRARSKAKKLRK